MKNIIFFTYDKWAFGTIHYELSKYLFNEGFNCQLLPWKLQSSDQELQNLDKTVDIWMTTYDGAVELNRLGILLSKCVVIAHSLGDYFHYDEQLTKELKNIGCISQMIQQYAIDNNHPIIPKICSLGINYNTFYTPPSEQLAVIGYAGSFCDKDEYEKAVAENKINNHKMWKRNHLIQECADIVGLEYKAAVFHTKTFVAMPGFYKSVDCVIISSTELEAGGLPALEAGAAGKLVISTPVGHWKEKVGNNGGIEVPIPEQEFKEKVIETIEFYKNNPVEYYNRCLQIQEHAKSYDWSNVIHQWVEILT